MIIKSSEHLTRYQISYKGREYLRLVEKGIDEIKTSWLLLSPEGTFILGDTESEELEIEFEHAIQ